MLPGKTGIYIPTLTDKKFDLLTQSRELRLCVRTKHALPWCCMFHSLNFICNMSTFSNKKGLTPPQGSMVCVRTELLYAPLPFI